jgi:hypothetical protein
VSDVYELSGTQLVRARRAVALVLVATSSRDLHQTPDDHLPDRAHVVSLLDVIGAPGGIDEVVVIGVMHRMHLVQVARFALLRSIEEYEDMVHETLIMDTPWDAMHREMLYSIVEMSALVKYLSVPSDMTQATRPQRRDSFADWSLLRDISGPEEPTR